MTKEWFNKLEEGAQYELFCKGISIGERTIVNGKICWCRQYDDFYILCTLDFLEGSKEYVAFRNTAMIEPFLADVRLPDDFYFKES